MKNSITLILVSILVFSCNINDKKHKTKTLKSENYKSVKDTTIEYEIDDVSTNGTVATATYKNNKIKKCVINIYGEMGQAEVVYNFREHNIKVSSINYNYAIEGDSINQSKPIAGKEALYEIDYNGLLISGNSEQEGFIDMFPEMKKTVPFELK